MSSGLFSYVAGWVEGLNKSERTTIVATMRPSDPSAPKQSVTVDVQGPSNTGQLTLWETGELETEVYSRASMQRVYVDSRVVNGESELEVALARLLEASEVASSEQD
jgi:hypothetical protein